jgi:plastocyanin
MRRALPAVAALAMLVLAPAAQADETVYAVPVDRYSSSVITIDQGEALFFRNADLNRHDLVSKAQSGGKPIFSTPLLSTGGEAVVQGVQQLKGGNYEFFCTVHTYMTGTLTVTGAGAPAPPPGGGGGGGGGGDTTAPTVSVKVVDSSVSKVVKNRKLRVDVTTNEGGNATLSATTRQGKKTVTIAKGTKGFARAGRATVALALTKAGQKALKGRKSAAVLVQVHQADAAGNTGRGRGSRTLKR